VVWRPGVGGDAGDGDDGTPGRTSGAMACSTKKVPLRLTSTTARHSSATIRPNGVTTLWPAQSTTPSRPPTWADRASAAAELAARASRGYGDGHQPTLGIPEATLMYLRMVGTLMRWRQSDCGSSTRIRPRR